MIARSKHGAAFYAVVVMSILFVVRASSAFNCWMCPRGEASFHLCDQNKIKEDCTSQKLDRCGTFSYSNKTGFRIYAKSCTTESLCSGNNTFCSVIPNAKDCRVQCCDTELCNFDVGFASTVAPLPTTTQPPTTTKPPTTTQSPTTTKPPIITTTPQTSTEPPPTEPDTSPTPETPTKDTQGDSDDDDCSWVDSLASPLTSSLSIVLGFHLLSLALFL